MQKGNDGRWYTVESLSLEDKIRLGFDKEVVKELEKIPEQKKIPVETEESVKKPRKKRTKKGS